MNNPNEMLDALFGEAESDGIGTLPSRPIKVVNIKMNRAQRRAQEQSTAQKGNVTKKSKSRKSRSR